MYISLNNVTLSRFTIDKDMIKDLGFRVHNLRFKIQDLEFRV